MHTNDEYSLSLAETELTTQKIHQKLNHTNNISHIHVARIFYAGPTGPEKSHETACKYFAKKRFESMIQLFLVFARIRIKRICHYRVTGLIYKSLQSHSHGVETVAFVCKE